jgi:hypothetical protein
MESTPRYAFTSLGQAAVLVLQNLEPRELRVAVEEQGQGDRTANGEGGSNASHVLAPVELAPASTSEAEKDSPAVVAACGCRAFVGLIVIRRPAKLRMWMW